MQKSATDWSMSMSVCVCVSVSVREGGSVENKTNSIWNTHQVR